MLESDDFLQELRGEATSVEEGEGSDAAYEFERDEKAPSSGSKSGEGELDADYGSEMSAEQEEGEHEREELSSHEGLRSEEDSEMDAKFQEMEEDELLQDELKMPSDLEAEAEDLYD